MAHFVAPRVAATQRELILVLGKTGSGKTSWLRHHVMTRVRRALIVDAGFNEFDASAMPSFDILCQVLEGCCDSHFWRVSYTPISSEFPFVLEAAARVGNLHLVLEEADRLPSPSDCTAYDEIITRGRHYGVSILAAALHPYKLPADLRRQATRIITFRQHEPRDLAWLSDVMGPDVDRLPVLDQYVYLDWSSDGIRDGRLSLEQATI